MFSVDQSGLKNLQKYISEAGKKFRAAENMWINRAAFGTRDNALAYLARNFTVRSPGFVRSRLRVEKATFSRQRAEVGSIRTQRFTGWAEQEGLAEDKRDKTVTPSARLGVITKRVLPRFRMKRSTSFRKPDDYAGRTRRQRANAMLQAVGRGRDKRPFVLYGHRTLQAGLWRFGDGPKGRRKLEALQIFGKKPPRPKRAPWMRSSVRKYFREIDRKRVWADIVRRLKANKR